MQHKNITTWFLSGTPWIWISASAVSICLIMVTGLLLLIAINGLSYFWPAELHEFHYMDADQGEITLVGEIHGHETVDASRLVEAGVAVPKDVEEVTRYLVKIGNRDLYGLDFRWLEDFRIIKRTTPTPLFVAERREWGNFFGYLIGIKDSGKRIESDSDQSVWQALEQRLTRVTRLTAAMHKIETTDIGAINYQLEQLRKQQRRLTLDGNTSPALIDQINQQKNQLNQQYEVLQQALAKLNTAIARDSLLARTSDHQEIEISLAQIVKVYRPNEMSWMSKCVYYIGNFWGFITDEPREANTEGGVFPAIFGTVLMVIIMSIFVTPFGVITAIYLREYAKQGILTRTIRIAVNNLAGVPSIVYGVFGLGFFVYFLGGNIDQLFYPESLPSPTFGTAGILWASLTLALLTVPVVIVATEEGLARVPRSIREGSLALGATKWETLWRTVIPMASPAMITGVILAVARAAGEVAPLMLVGVVKLAPSLPIDANFPYLHLDRKFMHLGFHIYDVGFQSPNVEAARPLVYATALLLIVVIVVLNFTAVTVRNRLREKYQAFDN